MTETIHVVARLTARTETVTALRSVLLDLVAPTRQESGCLRYQLLHNTADSTDFTFVEEWANEVALEAHFTMPYLQTALAQARPLLAMEPDIRRYTLLQQHC